MELLKFGGNDRLREFLDNYRNSQGESIFAKKSIQEKYSSNACKYYRHKIQSLAKFETPQMDAPTIEEAEVIIDDDIDGKSFEIIFIDWIVLGDLP